MPEQSTVKQSGLLEITYYTDPLCCWSWAFEPQWRRLLFEFKGKVKYRYCMAGLLPGWNNYNDTINSVSKPIQMGPVWMHAKQLSGMPIEQNIWISDPPSSSYPACIAVKCAALQSLRAEEHFLRMLREAVMMRGENISKEDVLLNLAEKLAAVDSDFKIEKFKEDIRSDVAMEALRKDLQEVQYHQINRFPSLVIRNKNNKGVLISGYRPYSILLDPIREMIEVKENKKINPKRYKDHWPFITERELEEIA
ncbi:MAG TPA: DsbA family protein [Hanamia sp.]|nr:DsbA family protein [Hanamia sp.]